MTARLSAMGDRQPATATPLARSQSIRSTSFTRVLELIEVSRPSTILTEVSCGDEKSPWTIDVLVRFKQGIVEGARCDESRTMFVRAAEMVRRPGLFWAENDADACRSFARMA